MPHLLIFYHARNWSDICCKHSEMLRNRRAYLHMYYRSRADLLSSVV